MSKTLLQLALLGTLVLPGLTASAQIPWVAETSLYAYCPAMCTLIRQTKQLQMYAGGVGWVQNETVYGMGAGTGISAQFTTDGGRSWQNFGSFSTSTGGIRSWWALPNLTAFGIAQTVSGTTEVWKNTMPGSSTWTPSFNVAGAVPLVVRFFDNNEGLIITTTFAVYRTTDQGATWTAASGPLPGSAGNTFGSIELLGNDVWLTTTQGQLWHSSNRGATWGPAVNVGLATNSWFKVSFSDAQNGLAYVPGGTQTIKRTSDGGATWSTINATGPRRLWVLTAVPGEPGTYLSGGLRSLPVDQAGLALSTDNGETWRTIESTYSYLFLQAASRTQVWAISYAPEYSAFLHSPGNVLSTRGGSKARPLAPAYPNPTTGPLHLPGGAGGTARVFDVTGRLQRTSLLAPNAVLDLSGLAPGRYQVQLTDKQGGSWSQAVNVVR